MDHEQQAAYDEARVKFKDPKKLDNMQFILNLVAALFVIGIGIYQIITFAFIIQVFTTFRFFAIFTPFFYLFFGLVLLFLEVGYKSPEIYKNFKFLKTYIGRSLFHFFLAGAVAGQIEEEFPRILWGILLSIPGLIYFILFCCGRREFNVVVRGEKIDEPAN